MKTFISCCQKSLIILLAGLLLWCPADAQFNYHRAYNLGANAHTPAHSLTASNEYINVGFYFPSQINGQPVSTARLPVLQLDAGFNVNWSKLYVTSDEVANNLFDVDMRGYDVKEVIGGGYVVCGEIVDTDVAGTTQKSSFIMRIDGGGNVMWFNKYFPDGNLNAVLETDDGGYLACGYVELSGGGEENRLLRVSASGTVIWLRTFVTSMGNGPHSAFRDLAKQSDGTYVAVGNCATLTSPDCGVTESDVLMVVVAELPGTPTTFTNYQIGRLTDPAGEQFAEFGNSVVVNGQGNVIIAGHVVKSNVNDCNPSSNIQDLLLLKVHPAGTVLFANEIDLQQDDIGRDVTINSLFSEICVAGISENNKNGFLYTTDMNGAFQKLEFFNHAGFDTQAKSVVENGAGFYTWIGNSEVIGTGYNDIYLVEQDPSTTQDCNDWDESRDPMDVDLEIFNPDEITLDQNNIPLEVEAMDLSVIDSVLCSEPCDPPVAVDDASNICESSTTHVSLDVFLNDTYTAPATLTTVFIPDFGVVTIGPGASQLNYLPDPGFVGTDTIEYVISDPCGSDTAAWVITVLPLPEALGFSYTTSGLTVSFTESSNNAIGWIWDFGDSNGTFGPTPTHTYASPGTYTVCMTVTNTCGNDQYCEEITVDEPCEPVDPVNDFMTACGGTGGSMNVLGNDFFTPPVTVSIVSGPSNGTASLTLVAPNVATLAYTPNAGFTGFDQVIYELCNLCGMCGTATVTIDALPPAPVANFSGSTSGLTVNFTDLSTNSPTSWAWDFGDSNTSTAQNPSHTYAAAGTYNVCLTASNICGSDMLCEPYTVNEPCNPVDPVNDIMNVCAPGGGSINVLTNDFYSSPITVVIISGPSNGTATLSSPGGVLNYVPNASFTGTDMLTYRLCNLCGMCGTATVTINVNAAPDANFSAAISGFNVNFTDLSTNNPTSWDWDFGDGTNSNVQNPTHTYTAPGTYTVCLQVDNECGSDTRCEDITICAPVDPVADIMDVCHPNGSMNVLLNDFYAGPVTLVIVSGPSNGTATLNNAGWLVYTPNASFTGTDMLTYRLCNLCGMCGTATVTINVNAAPVANFSGSASGATVNFTDLSANNPTSWLWDFDDGTTSTLQNPTHTFPGPGSYVVCLTATNICGSDQLCEDYTIIVCNPVDPVADVMDVCSPNGGSINVLTNDFYSSPITVVIISGPSNGTATLSSPGGVLNYVPNASFTGTDMLTYRLCNLCGMCGTATVTINVNAAPVANFSGTTSGQTVNFSDLSTNNPTSWFWDFGDGTTSTLQNPTHTYTAPGTYNVCLTATNICGSSTLCEEFTIIVCDNVDPVADQFTVCAPNGGVINPLLNDFFNFAPPTWNITGGPSNGTITNVTPNGDITYVPNAGFTGTDVITYELCDGCGNCYTETITITVIAAPVANFSGTTSGQTVNFSDLSTNNPTSWFWDFGDGTTSTLQNPTHTYTAPGTYNVCLTATNICGSSTLCEEFTIIVCDQVDPVADQFTVCSPNGGVINPLLNDFFNFAPPTWNITGGPSNGTITNVTPNGDITYVPNAGFTGTDVITYELCDGCGNCYTETITITVIAAPVANFSGTTSGQTVNFSDLSTNNPTSWSWDFGDGTTSTLQNPTHTYTAPGTYNVCLTATNICGSSTLCEEFTIIICDNVDPVADQFTVCAPNGGVINPLLNDFFNFAPPTWNITGGPSNGTITNVTPNGDITYVPNAGFTGTDVITYELCDGCGNCYTETITITVIAAPVANFSGTTSGQTVNFSDLSTNNPTSWFWDFGDGTTSTLQNPTHTYTAPGTYNVCLTATNICGSSTLCEEFTIIICDNVDPVADQFTVCSPNGGVINPLLNDFFNFAPPTWNITGGPSNGTITNVTPNGDITYVPNAGFTGTDVITYELCDGCGNCYTETITITVIAAPVANFSGTTSGQTVNFSDLSTNNPTSWFWDFGDGTTSTLQNPTHTYTAPGTYSVCLIVTNVCGSNEICEEFTITSCSPIDPVNDQLNICTPNGGGINILANDFFMGIVNYTFISGPGNGTITSDDGNGNIYYVPNAGFTGNDTITYMLCNQCGMCGTAQIIISVMQQPDAGFGTTVTGLSAVFSNAPSNYDTYFWHLGDGNTSTTGPTVAHTYSAPGDYTICLTVTNICGTDTHCTSVIIGDPCETPIAVTDLEQVCPDESVSFNVLINDSYTPPPFVQIVVPPSHGTLTFVDPATGDMTYLASSSFPGNDSLMYLLIDPCGSDTAWVHLACDGGILIDPHVILEGFYDVQQQVMSEGLYDNQLLPLQQPFSGAPWNYTGLEFVNSYADFSGIDGNVSDWIMVYLLHPVDPGTIIDRQACLLWSNGQVTGVDGGPVEFDQPDGDYQLALMPRNHLGVATGIIHYLDKSSTKLIDFTDPSEPTYGGGTDRKAIGSIMALFSGDANGDGAVNAFDKNAAWGPQNGSAPNYLNTADFNGDGAVNAVDKNLFWNPNNGTQGQYPYPWP